MSNQYKIIDKGIRKSNQVWHELFAPNLKDGSDMDVVEALEIVLGLARDHEDEVLVEWNTDCAEACGIIDGLLTSFVNEEEGK